MPRFDAPSRSRSTEHRSHVPDGGDRASHGARDLRTPGTDAVGHVDLLDAPAGLRREHDHLEWPARTAIGDAELHEVVPAGRPHRPEIPDRKVQRSAEPTGEVAVGQPGVDGPGPAGSDAGTEHQVGPAAGDRLDDADEVGRIERTVGIHEAHDVGVGGLEAGPAGLSETAAGLVDHQRTELPGDPTGSVRAAVVDDDRPEAIGHGGEEGGERGGLVEDGKHDVGHGGGRYHEASNPSDPAFDRDRWKALITASVGLAVAVWLAAVVGSRVLDPRTFVNAPPFYGWWRGTIGWTTVAPIAVAIGVIWAARHRHRVSWRWLLIGAVVAAVAWSISLGVADNIARLTEQLRGKPDYANGLGAIGDHPGNYLATFTEQARGPSKTVIARGYPVHVQGHPPGAVLTLWALTKLGLSPIAGGVVLVWSGLVAAIVAVLSSVRRLAGETTARAAAPFVVLLPATVWAHTFDTFFAGVGALAVMASVFALVAEPGRTTVGRARWSDGPSLRWAVLSGLLFGYLALLSYGLVLLALVPVVVAYGQRRLWPLLATGATAAATMALPAAWGFNWFGGLATTHHQYVTTVASIRPYRYFVGGNLVITACAIGPAVMAGFVLTLRSRPWVSSKRSATVGRWGGAAPLVVGASAALLAADLSGLAKSEVERIFQPFFGWMALAGVAIAAPVRMVRRDRVEAVALLLQAAVAIALATQLDSPW